jgi:hypothetical protein
MQGTRLRILNLMMKVNYQKRSQPWLINGIFLSHCLAQQTIWQRIHHLFASFNWQPGSMWLKPLTYQHIKRIKALRPCISLGETLDSKLSWKNDMESKWVVGPISKLALLQQLGYILVTGALPSSSVIYSTFYWGVCTKLNYITWANCISYWLDEFNMVTINHTKKELKMFDYLMRSVKQ